jgi:ATP-dependent DNA helicase RecG
LPHVFEVSQKRVVVFEIPAARGTPVSFSNVEFIRIGDSKAKLRDFPDKERAIWLNLQTISAIPFEKEVALENLAINQVIALLDFSSYFDIMKIPLPTSPTAIVEALIQEDFVVKARNGNSYAITNLGAIAIAKDLRSFNNLERKSIRILKYFGKNKIQKEKEEPVFGGYLISFELICQYTRSFLPSSEKIGMVFREDIRPYPDISIRESLANALIHQDFSISGSGVSVEIYLDRVEFINPGTPLIDVQHFINYPPRSRNEKLASLMRRAKICEEEGSGIDKIINAAESYQLPPPDFRVPGNNTVAILFAPRPFSEMTRDERVRACYQHACLMYVGREAMNNTSLRARFAVEDKNYPVISAVIRDTINAGLIKPDPSTISKRFARYLPAWA